VEGLSTKSICVLGTFPPPVHGMALVNEAVCNMFSKAGFSVTRVDLSPGTSRFAARLRRVWPFLKALFRFPAILRRSRTLYVGLSGGMGQLYELTFLLLAQLLSRQLVLHHHSFAYLNTSKILTTLLCRIAGKHAVHVVLSPHMGNLLLSRYTSVGNVVVISNAAFLKVHFSPSIDARLNLKSVGYLGNISREKGIFTYLDTMALLNAHSVPIQGLIAGPFLSRSLEKAVRNRLSGLPNVHYLGPVYGASKRDFLQNVDVLLFPSTYANEAEPLTIYEALASGVPVIGSAAGCIPEVLSAGSGAVIDMIEQFPSRAAALIGRWSAEPEEYRRTSKGARARYCSIRDTYEAEVKQFVARLVAGSAM
jgi:glycosyltransferase involved in cell wall biosynthesis